MSPERIQGSQKLAENSFENKTNFLMVPRERSVTEQDCLICHLLPVSYAFGTWTLVPKERQDPTHVEFSLWTWAASFARDTMLFKVLDGAI